MVLLFLLGIGLVIVAILLIGSALNTQTESGVTRSLAVLEAMTNAPKESFLSPYAIAESYWWLTQQDRSAWTFELDLRP